MKKLIASCCLVASVPFLAACGGGAPTYHIAEPGQWKDGTYTESAKGYRGDFAVTVTVKDGKMTAIDVGKHNETPDRGGKAIKTMPDAMIDAQSHEVDGISSATRTSDGLKDAVARALEKASEDTPQ